MSDPHPPHTTSTYPDADLMSQSDAERQRQIEALRAVWSDAISIVRTTEASMEALGVPVQSAFRSKGARRRSGE